MPVQPFNQNQKQYSKKNLDGLSKNIDLTYFRPNQIYPKICIQLRSNFNSALLDSLMPKEFVVQMGGKYPFGQLGQVINQDTSTSVCKRLHHQCQEEYELIQQMIHFLKAARHENLVNLKQVLENQRQTILYYEYVPFRLQGWLLDVNQQLISQLQVQFLQLAQYLCRSSIKFSFNPECVGLSAQMKLKYFLDEFVIDIQNGSDDLSALKEEIHKFFTSLRNSKKRTENKEENNKTQEKQFKKSMGMESISTNGSYSTQEDLSSLTKALAKLKVQTTKQRQTKEAMITAKVQNSKKKCQQLLERFKKVTLK